MKKLLVALVIVFCSTAWGSKGKIVDIQPYGQINGWGAGLSLVTVEIDGEQYTGEYLSRRVKDLVVGDPIEAEVSKNDLKITDSKGKTQKGVIKRRAHAGVK